MTARERRPLAPVLWALFLGYVVTAVVTWVSFFPVPLVFSTAIAALLGFACVKQERGNEGTEGRDVAGERRLA